MLSRLVKIIGAVVVGALLAMACGGIASAGPSGDITPTTHTAAAQLKQLHDQLQAAMQDENLDEARASVDALRPILAQLEAAPLARDAADRTVRTDGLAAQAQRGLSAAHTDPLAVVTNLLQTLLGAVLDLVTGLLGGLPVPMPGLPMPGLPGLPVPLPLPGAPEPGTSPVPELPLPVPVPDLPTDPAPEPEAPEPSDPSDELPELPELPDVPALP